MTWQPLKTAPKRTPVLINCPEQTAIFVAYYDDIDPNPRWKHFDSWGDAKGVQTPITGWMPLPGKQQPTGTSGND